MSHKEEAVKAAVVYYSTRLPDLAVRQMLSLGARALLDRSKEEHSASWGDDDVLLVLDEAGEAANALVAGTVRVGDILRLTPRVEESLRSGLVVPKSKGRG